MAESGTKAAPAKSTTTRTAQADPKETPAKSAPRVEHTELPETDVNQTGADRPLAKSSGEDRPKDFGANDETYDSSSWAQTHGADPRDTHDLADF